MFSKIGFSMLLWTILIELNAKHGEVGAPMNKPCLWL